MFGALYMYISDIYQKNIWYTKNIFWYTKILFGRPKKLEIDRTIGIPKRLTKSTWTPLSIFPDPSLELCCSSVEHGHTLHFVVVGGKITILFPIPLKQ